MNIFKQSILYFIKCIIHGILPSAIFVKHYFLRQVMFMLTNMNKTDYQIVNLIISANN